MKITHDNVSYASSGKVNAIEIGETNFDTQFAPISVVIPTNLNIDKKQETILLVIDSLARQTILPEEIIVISSPQASFFDNLSDTFPTLRLKTLCCSEIANRSIARNAGANAASMPFLLFMDDDTILLSADSLERVMPLLSETFSFACAAKRYWSKYKFTTSSLKDLIDEGIDLRSEEYSVLPHGINRRNGLRDLFEFSFVANFGIVRRDYFNIMGGFTAEIFGECGGEDTELMYRFYLDNQEFVSLYELVDVLHISHPISPEEMVKREFGTSQLESVQKEHGYDFCVNNLFGVDELPHEYVLVPLQETH